MKRRGAGLLLCVLLLVEACGMAPVQADKIERFKVRVGFDDALRAETSAEAVSVVWPDMLTAPGLGAGRWQVAGDTTWRQGGGVSREWVLRHDQEHLLVTIFVATEGNEPAREFLLTRAGDNMMVEVPYDKGPAGLGTFAVAMPPVSSPSELIWVFRNVCFGIRGIRTGVDLLAIARWLQSHAEGGLVPAAAAQPTAPGPMRLSTQRAAVGEAVEIRLQAATPSDEARYMIDLDFDRDALEVASQARHAAQVAGRVPGTTAIDLYLIDTATLLSSRNRIELEVTPASP